MVSGLLLLLEVLTPGYLILDDVLIPKPFAHYVAGTYPGYDPAQKRHLVGQYMVVFGWTNGLFCIPAAFACWPHRLVVRRSRTKNGLARLLVSWTVRHHLPCPDLTFDNWYASKHNLKFFTKFGLVVVTKVRHNANIHDDDPHHHVSWLRKVERHYYADLQAYVRQFTGESVGYGTGQLALVKPDKHAEPGRTKDLFTNALTLTNRAFVRRDRSRWTRECFFSNLSAVLWAGGLSGANDATSPLPCPDGLPGLPPDAPVDERPHQFNGTDADTPAVLDVSLARKQLASESGQATRWDVPSSRPGRPA